MRIVGNARPAGSLVRAPCSQRTCIAYELTVRHTWTELRWMGGLRMEGHDERLLSEQDGADFVIETAGGSVLVPWSADVKLRLRSSRLFIRSADDIPAEWTSILERHRRRRDFGRGEARFIESRLHRGSEVAVAGRAGLLKDPAGAGSGYRTSPTRWVLLPADEGLVVSNEREALGL